MGYLFHKLSTDAKPMHHMYPIGELTWCGYTLIQDLDKKYSIDNTAVT